jgi:hypothetical protein
MLSGMAMGAAGALQAWAPLAGLANLGGLQVVVDAESPLGRRGWIGILAIDQCRPGPGLLVRGRPAVMLSGWTVFGRLGPATTWAAGCAYPPGMRDCRWEPSP